MIHVAWRQGIAKYDPTYYDWYMLTKYPGG
jgi:hypothetical protein